MNPILYNPIKFALVVQGKNFQAFFPNFTDWLVIDVGAKVIFNVPKEFIFILNATLVMIEYEILVYCFL